MAIHVQTLLSEAWQHCLILFPLHLEAAFDLHFQQLLLQLPFPMFYQEEQKQQHLQLLFDLLEHSQLHELKYLFPQK